jgi:PAS domain S-box-containing protein
MSLGMDSDERNKVDTSIHEAEYRQRLALEIGRMGTWDWNIEEQTSVWDERQQELFGFQPGEYDADEVRFYERVLPEDGEMVRRKTAECLATDGEFEAEVRVRLPDGQIRWIGGRGIVIRDKDRRPVRMIGINYDITERKNYEKFMTEALREKEALLKEIHHRVKNNLQVISSLLSLQLDRISDPQTRSVFIESQNRVRAMALVHEVLYGSDSLAGIELPRYLDRLSDSLLQSFGDYGRIRVERKIEKVVLDLDRALPIGLITSELVSNALKYAFPDGRSGTIQLQFSEFSAREYSFKISDDGVGLPPELDIDQTTSLGLYLIRILSKQLRGRLKIDLSHGTSFTLCFPK